MGGGSGVGPVLFTFPTDPLHELPQFPSFLGPSPKPPHPLRQGSVLHAKHLPGHFHPPPPQMPRRHRHHPIPPRIPMSFTPFPPGTASDRFRRRQDLLPIGPCTPGRSAHCPLRLLRILGRIPNQPFRFPHFTQHNPSDQSIPRVVQSPLPDGRLRGGNHRRPPLADSPIAALPPATAPDSASHGPVPARRKPATNSTRAREAPTRVASPIPPADPDTPPPAPRHPRSAPAQVDASKRSALPRPFPCKE